MVDFCLNNTKQKTHQFIIFCLNSNTFHSQNKPNKLKHVLASIRRFQLVGHQEGCEGCYPWFGWCCLGHQRWIQCTFLFWIHFLLETNLIHVFVSSWNQPKWQNWWRDSKMPMDCEQTDWKWLGKSTFFFELMTVASMPKRWVFCFMLNVLVLTCFGRVLVVSSVWKPRRPSWLVFTMIKFSQVKQPRLWNNWPITWSVSTTNWLELGGMGF